jgi:parallel beta-helix repeat protein
MSKNQWWPRRRRPSDVAWRLRTGRHRASARGRNRLRPAVLVLEDRRLLSGVIDVTNTADSGDGSLRQAIEEADLATSPVKIDFKLATPATITLTSGQLELSNTAVPIAIDGPGAGRLTIDGNDSSRVFQVDPNVSATLSDLTISGGYFVGDPLSNAGGGGIYNSGTVALNRVTLSGNSSFYGAALYDSGTATMTDCTVTGNNGNGQVVFITGQAASVSIVDSNFFANLYDYSVVDITRAEALTITGTTFHANTCAGVGQVIHSFETSEPNTLVGCTISGNPNMAGIFSVGASQAVVDCSISGNFIGVSVGTVAGYGGSTTIAGTTISGNRGYGGLILRGSSTVDNCSINDNYSPGYGGGVDGGDTLAMSDCTISGNTALRGGGGIYLSSSRGSTSTLTNCTIEGNAVVGPNGPYPARGGGVFNEGTDQLIGCTVTGNSATQGGGVYNYTYPGQTFTLGLTDTIVAGNTDGNGAASDVTGGDPADVTGSYNLIGTGGSGGLTAADHNLLNIADPGLAPLGDYGGPTETMALQLGSPARHAGTPVAGVNTDQRGFSLDSPPDIGAFQSQPGPLVVDTAIDGLGSPPGELSLRQAVNLADVLTGGATIAFDKSTFARHSVIALTAGPLELSNATGPITILGPGLGKLAISGAGASRVFQVDKGTSASLSGLNITGGFATGDGGGLLNLGTVNLSGDAIVGNSAVDGGGVANSGTAVILGSSIDGNVASADGGGIFNTGALTLILSDLSANSAALDGGGLFNRGTAALGFCTIDDNSASAGGGVYADPSGQPVVLIGTDVERNKGGNIFGRVIQL